MKIKVFKTNSNGKIEFTQTELENLLNEIYKSGYAEGEDEGRKNNFTWTSPYINTTPHYGISTSTTTSAQTESLAINGTVNDGVLSTSNAYLASAESDEVKNCCENENEPIAEPVAEPVVESSRVSENIEKTIGNNPSYSIKVNGKDVSDLFSAFFGLKPETHLDVFDKLGKELNF